MSKGVGISNSPESKFLYPALIFFCKSDVSKYSFLSERFLNVPPSILFNAISGSQSTHMHKSGINAAEFI